MSGPHTTERFPRGLLIAAGVLTVFTILIAGATKMNRDQDEAALLESATAVRDLRFDVQSDETITVTDAQTDETVDVLEPGSEGFIRGVLRGLTRERIRFSASPDAPYRVAQLEDGRYFLQDPATDQTISLGSFGPTNAQAFGRLLTAGQKDQE